MEEWDSYKVIELVATGREKVRALESLIVFQRVDSSNAS